MYLGSAFLAIFASVEFCGVLKFRRFNVRSGTIPTAPTNHLPDWSGFNNFTRGQKGADKAIDPVLVRYFSAARVTTGFVSLHRFRGNIIAALWLKSRDRFNQNCPSERKAEDNQQVVTNADQQLQNVNPDFISRLRGIQSLKW